MNHFRILLCCFLVACIASNLSAREPGEKPNIILIMADDFYATLAEAAGVKLGADDPIDGRSFLPQLRGKKGDPRDWVLCHYQPYWNKTPGQYARTASYKLYRDGRYYHVPVDLRETKDLPSGTSGPTGEAIRRELDGLLDRCPPAPVEPGKRTTKLRPVYPKWKDLLDPND